jgi:hypothetical protein
MASKNFKHISPGVKISEIDNSQLPQTPGELGTLVIGRANRGPAMRPVRVSSFSEFVDIFGEPTPQNGFSDIWRDSQITGPTYGVYAAQAVLNSQNSLTFVRLLGTEHSEKTNAGRAGWSAGAVSSQFPGGGAYGLFVFPSGSAQCSGTLAAVWYLTTGSVELSGNILGNSTSQLSSGTSGLFESNTSQEFRVIIKNDSGVIVENTRFNFDASSEKFVRKAFNTNPTLTNSTLYTATDRKIYFLGESFEDFINESREMAGLRGATTWLGTILPLKHFTTSPEHSDKRLDFQNGQTGWFFSQDFSTNYSAYQGENMTKLFKFHSLDSGEWNQNNIKISIKNIKVSQNPDFSSYGTFDVLIRSLNDTDANPEILEQFSNCSLNPEDTENYIGIKIGDKYVSFNNTTRYNDEIGEFDNKSKFVRVEISDRVASKAIVAESLPYGVYGPVTYKSFAIVSGSIGFVQYRLGAASLAAATAEGPFVRGGTGSYSTLGSTSGTVGMLPAGGGNFTGSVIYPKVRLRIDTTSGSLSNPTNAYFGVYTDDTNNKFAKSIKDIIKARPADVDSFTAADSSATQYSWVFSLDDIGWYNGSAVDATWASGSRVAGTSFTAQTGTYAAVLNAGYNSFTTILAGGFDGLDITEIEPFRNSGMSSASDKTSYEFNTIKRAIDIVRDQEEVEFNVACIPGLTNTSLTAQLIEMCENRADALAIIDLTSDYVPRSESSETQPNRISTVSSMVTALKSRGLNSTYGTAYSTWVQIKDTISNSLVYVPPTVYVAGVYASNDRLAAPWHAPAGYTRANLSNGSAGLSVVNVLRRLRSADRDLMYDARINPIANLTNTGIVIMGQKTLAAVPTALDRVNVRRAMLYLKKVIAKVANNVLFDQNVRVTWNRFISKVDPILRNVLIDNGIEDYRLILDESTTTADLRDRNTMYAIILIKPAKSIEFIQIDFNINPSGANFDTVI